MSVIAELGAPPWLFSGPAAGRGPEWLAGHTARLGPCPAGGPQVISELEAGGLRGRGGARFPAARKWRAVSERSRGDAVVVVNAAEGEPGSFKDRSLLTSRPHLVLDGALLAVETVRAAGLVLYVNQSFADAISVLRTALSERRLPPGLAVDIVPGPPRYVAGEETAAVRFINGGDAKPTFVPPRPYERGVDGRPTLVGNVETFACAALVARQGAGWYRSVGTNDSPGTMLLTITGAVERPGVYETAHGVRLAEAIEPAGASIAASPGLLVGGYFGSWVEPELAEQVRLDDQAMLSAGLKIGAGVIHVLPAGACGVVETARVLGYLSHESARQCGPCIHGLRDVALAAEHLAGGRGDRSMLEVLPVWASQLESGRGACKHPDGAIGLLKSALRVFAEDFRVHASGACRNARNSHSLPIPGALGRQSPSPPGRR